MRFPSIANAIETARKQIELQGDTFEYRDELLPCSAGKLGVDATLQLGGLDVAYDLVLCVRKSVVSDIPPQPEERITFRDVRYIVKSVEANPSDVFYNIGLRKLKT